MRGAVALSLGGRGPDRHIWTGRAKQRTELLLKDLQKHFLGAWFTHMQDLTMVMLTAARDAARGGAGEKGPGRGTPQHSARAPHRT